MFTHSGVEILDREEFVNVCNSKLKLVRTEFSLSQEKMSLMLGISKKTLVEIEKGRSSLGWSGSVVLCSIFCESQIIRDTFGVDPAEIIRMIAFEKSEPNYRHANTKRIWWQTVLQNDKYLIEQNIVSQHYRLLTIDGKIVASSFNIDELKEIM